MVGDLPGTTLADWPISYDDLEPYYDKVEWAFGVSGLAGANAYEGPRSTGYPCPPLPPSSYAKKFHEGCPSARLERLPDPAGRAVPPLQRPSGNGDQRLRPAARRPDRHPVQRAERLRPRRAGHRPLRPAAGQLRPGAGRRCRGQDHCRGLPGRGRRRYSSRRPTSSSWPAAPSRPPGCCCCRNPARFPNGLANGSDMVGRNVTFHEYSAAIGALRRPDLRLGRRRLRQRQHASVLQPRRLAAGSSSGGHIACAGVGIPLPINWGLPGRPTWGAEAKTIDRDYFNHSMAVAMVRARHAAARQPGRSRRRRSSDAWGLPVARITLTPTRTTWRRAGSWSTATPRSSRRPAPRGDRVYTERVTGNCSHQHGTTADGQRPRDLGAGPLLPRPRGRQPVRRRRRPFPTGTGANPTLTIMANAWRVAEHIAGGGRG